MIDQGGQGKVWIDKLNGECKAECFLWIFIKREFLVNIGSGGSLSGTDSYPVWKAGSSHIEIVSISKISYYFDGYKSIFRCTEH